MIDVSAIVTQISFLIVAINWPELAKECDRIDFHMKRYGFPKFLKLKLNAVCVIFMIFSLGKIL